jgi:hypothetical protein
MKDSQPILFVPLDDRPCCLDLVLRLASLAGRQVLTPSRAALGRFQKPGEPAAILDWLQSQPSDLPLIASLDMLSWGGLIASRHPGSDPNAARTNFERFLAIQDARQAPTYAFKTLLRTAPTQTSVEETEQAEQIVALSRLGFLKEKLRASGRNGSHIDAAMAQLKDSISPDFLDRYMAVRKRNHQFDRYIVESASHFDALLVAMDDCQTEGWNLLEKESLQRLAEERRMSVDFYPGTDESAGLLLARLLSAETGVEPVWSHSHLSLTQTRYEDRPLGALLQSQLQAARLRQGRCRRKLFLFGRLGTQQEADRQAGGLRIEQETIEQFLVALETALDAGDSCVVADLAFANGGDLGLVDALLERRLASRLTGYSAWNTAGNTLGTALAMLALYPDQPTPQQERARRLLLWERLTDDAFYQSRFRFRLKKEIGPGLNLAEDDLKEAERLLGGEFHNFAAQLWGRLFPEEPPIPFRITLPWGRLFEVAIEPSASTAA